VDTYVYVDGFNLYYGAVKGTSLKWLDLKALCERIFPKNNIARIKYFTARVHPTPSDSDKPLRQTIYLRALRQHIPCLEIIEGYFLVKPVRMPLVTGKGTVEVIKTEEKGSDVNLAVHLINDAWKGRYQAAIVVSNDSDLVEAIRLVKSEHRLPVGVLNPQMQQKKKMAVQLNKVASFRGQIAVADLVACQLPDPIPGTNIQKPAAW
jgi:hypothetical protein